MRPSVSKLLAELECPFIQGEGFFLISNGKFSHRGPLIAPWPVSCMFQLVLPVSPGSGGLHLAPTPASEPSMAQKTVDCGS